MLVGREAQTLALTALLDRATDQRGGAMVQRGEAGIGKTALLAHLATLALGLQQIISSATGPAGRRGLPWNVNSREVRLKETER